MQREDCGSGGERKEVRSGVGAPSGDRQAIDRADRTTAAIDRDGMMVIGVPGEARRTWLHLAAHQVDHLLPTVLIARLAMAEPAAGLLTRLAEVMAAPDAHGAVRPAG